jgi:hypothetical protein
LRVASYHRLRAQERRQASASASPTGSFAVPEPSTWAMMALGFAALGLLGYRKTPRDNALA